MIHHALGFSGRYRLQIFHADTDILKYDTGWFDNLITDAGLDLLGTGYGGGTFWIGTNAAPATVTDTTITGPVGSVTNNFYLNDVVTTPPCYGYMTYKAEWNISAAVGTFHEVGTGPSTTNLFSRALIADVNGTPVSLTLTAIDRLTLYYELRQYFDASDQTFNILIDGVATTCLRRPWYGRVEGLHVFSPSLSKAMYVRPNTGGNDGGYFYTSGTTPFIGATPTEAPSGTAACPANYSAYDAYVPGSHQRTSHIGILANQGAVANITAKLNIPARNNTSGAGRENGGAWQYSFSPPISKTQYEDLRLTFVHSWGRL